MDDIFTGLSDELVSTENTPINWAYISIGLVVGAIIYFVIKYFFMKKEKTVTFDCADGKCPISESNTSHNTDDPKNINYCEGDKCYI